MSTAAIITAIVIYLALGALAIGFLEVATKRVSANLRPASDTAHDKLMQSGNFMSHRGAFWLTLGALWLFWPLAICGAVYGALEDSGRKEESDGEKQGKAPPKGGGTQQPPGDGAG